MSCIFQWGGSQSLYATLDIWVATLKGLYCLGDSFGVMLARSLRLSLLTRLWFLWQMVYAEGIL